MRNAFSAPKKRALSAILEKLNLEQVAAVTATEGFIRVYAGAGSGKTRALTHRFAYLVNEIGVLPSNILCVTFTNKAANEMKQRIRTLTGDNDTGYICTFHSFCVSVLQEDSNAVQYPKNFLVLDNSDIDAMLKLIYEERGLTLRHMTYSNARDMIEIRKCITEPEYYNDMIAMSPEQLKEKYLNAVDARDIIFYGYLYQEKKCFGLDYNDLINFTLYIFKNDETLKLKWQQRLEYIMIDEFQDIDKLQYTLMDVLCGYHKNLFIVGDPDQTIYTWRGANVKYLLDFDKKYPNVETINMMKNYRSTAEIVSVANSLISKNTRRADIALIPTLPSGIKVEFCHQDTAENEAKWIFERIKQLEKQGVAQSDIALLYRANYVTRIIENVFLHEKLPYTIYSSVQFYDRLEIKDALSYLRMLVYKDDLSFMRTANMPKRNLGEKRMRFLRSYAAERQCSLFSALKSALDDELFKNTKAAAFINMVERLGQNCVKSSISELLTAVLHQSGYEEALRTEGAQERLDNLAELKQSIYEYETTCGEESTLENYLNHVALFTNMDTCEHKNAVKLMTVHAAKGLEFPYVFLCAFEEGVFPSKKTSTLESMEEERRLAYVAITRAEKGLFITDSQGRNHDGSNRYPSRFLFNIDKSLIDYTYELPEQLVKDAMWYIKSATELLSDIETDVHFSEGDRVRHPIMGEGNILQIDNKAGAYLIKFDALLTPRKISFKAKLEAL